MAYTFPFDLLAGFPGWQSKFELSRRQESSRTAFGKTIVKDLGDPLWTATYVSKELKPNQLDMWRSRLEILDGALNTFKAYVLSRCYPISHPRGAWPGGVTWNGIGALGTISTNRKEVALAGVVDGFTLRAGDVFMIGEGRIHRVVTAVRIAVGTTMAALEVRPHIRPDISAGATVTFVRPWCLMNIDPNGAGSDSSINGRGPVTFSATEAI